MKSSLILIAIILSYNIFGQTKLIAHKSHSGNMAYFSPLKGPDNLGETPEMIEAWKLKNIEYEIPKDSLIKISDCVVILKQHDFYQPSSVRIDTIINHPLINNNSITADSLKRLIPDAVFIGFDSLKAENSKVDTLPPMKDKLQHPVKSEIPKAMPTGPKKMKGKPVHTASEAQEKVKKAQFGTPFLVLIVCGFVCFMTIVNLVQYYKNTSIK